MYLENEIYMGIISLAFPDISYIASFAREQMGECIGVSFFTDSSVVIKTL